MISLELKKKIGQMIMAGFPEKTAGGQAGRLLDDFMIGNYIYFSRNVEGARQLAQLTKDLSDQTYERLGIAPFVSMDQEGGLVSRITEGAALIPGAAAVSAAVSDEAVYGSTAAPEQAVMSGGHEAAGADLSAVYQLGRNTGEILRAAGVNMDLAPDLDVNVEPKNPVIGARSYSDDPVRVARLASAMLKGLEDAGVVGCIKHYPGHGNTASDSHLGIPVNDTSFETLLETEFKPFELAVRSGATAVLSAHVRYMDVDAENPGSLSYQIQTELLRGRYGFTGLVLTDCLEMDAIRVNYPQGEGAVRAIEAGADILCISHTYEAVQEAVEAIYRAVESGRLSEARIHASYERIIRSKVALGLMKWQGIDPAAAERLALDPEKIALAQQVAAKSVTLVAGGDIGSCPEKMAADGELAKTGIAGESLNQEEKIRFIKNSLVIASDHMASTGVEDMRPLSLGRAMQERYGCKTITFPLGLTEEEAPEVIGQIDRAYESTKVPGAIPVFLGLYNARFRAGARKVAEHVLQLPNVKVTVLLMGMPYDISMFADGSSMEDISLPTNISGVITTYEYTRLTVDALLHALETGEFSGHCPFRKLI